MNKRLSSFLDGNNIKYEIDVNLKNITWISRGGLARIYILPFNQSELLITIKFLYANKLKFLIIGHTSNMYIYNSCNIDIVVTTRFVNKYEMFGDFLYCDAGVSVIKLANDMIKRGVRGFEYLTDLPGTIGAAICNNSSCRENSITKLLYSVDIVLNDGRFITMKPNELNLKYRSSIFKEKKIDGVIIRACLDISSKYDVEKLKCEAIKNKNERRDNLEGHRFNLGCTVNRCFENGKMPICYRVLLKVYECLLRVIENDKNKIQIQTKNFLCEITGYKQIAPYVSSRNMSIFLWKDEKADAAFPKYLEFMEKIYKTNRVEIDIIK